jgi:O-antigen/teichoic acid export membrane protein
VSRLAALPLRALRSIVGASFVLLAARAGGTLLGFFLQAILARTLGAEGLGIYYVMVSLSGVAAVVGAVGYPVIASRFVPRYRAQARPTLLRLFLRIGFIDITIVAVVLSAAVALGGIIVAEDPQMRWALIFAAASIPPLAIGRFAAAVANATRRFFVGFLPDLVGRPLLLLVLVATTLLSGGSVTVLEMLVYYALISWALALLQLGTLNRSRNIAQVSPPRPKRVGPVWRRLAAILMLTPLLTSMLGDVNMLLLAPLLDGDDIGVFGASLKMAMLVGFFVQIIHQTMLPDLAEAVNRRRLQPALDSTVLANRVAFVFVLVSAVILAACGDRLLAVFGEEFVVGHWPLVLIVLGLAPRAATGPISQLLVVLGRENLTVASGVLSVAYLAAANAVLVPLFGLAGAALAFTSMMVISSLAISWLLWRQEGLRADIFARRAPARLATRLGEA